MEREKQACVKSLGKALQLIDIINQARTPLSLMRLSQLSGYPKSTVYALLNTLRQYDCIRQENDGRYYLGTRLFEWGCGVSASWALGNVAQLYLEQLSTATDATALLSRLEGSSAVVINQFTAASGGIHVTTESGTHLPLHATSQGKLLLAAMSDASAKAFLTAAGPLKPFTPKTIVDPDGVLQTLRQIRSAGYAVENEEYKVGLCSVSAPVYDGSGSMSYALSVVGLFGCVRSPDFRNAVSNACAMAQQMSYAIGFKGDWKTAAEKGADRQKVLSKKQTFRITEQTILTQSGKN